MKRLMMLLILPLAAPWSVTQDDMGYLLLMGIYMLPLGTALMFIGPRYIPAPEVGLLLLLESILGPVWVCFDERDPPPEHVLEEVQRSIFEAMDKYNLTGRWPGASSRGSANTCLT